MTYKKCTLEEHLQNDGQPKRILALDGGGLRGILTVGILKKIEDILRERHGGSEDFRLGHYFDLIAGTSTGSIIAAALAMEWTVDDIYQKYMELGEKVFEKSLLRQGLIRAKYDEKKLIKELKDVYGEQTLLGSPSVQTGLMIMTKRVDTGSPWPISNNPRGKYFKSRPKGTIGNGDYPLWKVVRASTAAPAYFDPEEIVIAERQGHPTLKGQFVDGGVSPFNNPALQSFMYATMDGYRIGWPTGAEKIQLVSIGTGKADPVIKKSKLAGADAIKALVSLMDDSAALQETLLQWMSSSPTAMTIDRELNDLKHDLVAGSPLLSYLRYNADLDKDSVKSLIPDLRNSKVIESLTSMDKPENMPILHKLGTQVAKRDVHPDDFAANFDLP